jgi:hypothetical protein
MTHLEPNSIRLRVRKEECVQAAFLLQAINPQLLAFLGSEDDDRHAVFGGHVDHRNEQSMNFLPRFSPGIRGFPDRSGNSQNFVLLVKSC